MKKQLILLSLMMICLFRVSAQNTQTTYHTAVGLRLGTGYSDLISLSLKTFLSDGPGALEFNLGVKPNTDYYNGCCSVDNTNVTTLSFSTSYQYHVPITSVPGLQWFVGGGFTLMNTFSSENGYAGVGLGLFPTGGGDYKFGRIPLEVSIDIRPTFRLASPQYYNYENFYFPDFGFSARYTIY